MSVPDQPTVFVYTGNGVTNTFAYGFYLLSADDIVVSINDVVTTAYTVNGIGSQSGGAVIFNSAPATGAKIVILRQVAIERNTDYQRNGDLRAQTLNLDFDRLWMALQDNQRDKRSSIRYPIVENLDGELPSAGNRAFMIIGFDALGNHTLMPIPSSLGAGDLRIQEFASGVGFIPDVTTVLTLDRTPISKANCWVYWDGVPQLDFTVAGNLLTFPTPIPTGISKVYVRTGTTLSLNIPATGSVDDEKVAIGSSLFNRINDFPSLRDVPYLGRVDGITDDAGAIDDFLADHDDLTIPAGVCRIKTNTTIPNGKTLRMMAGAQFEVDPGVTLTIRGQFHAPIQHIFTGTGTVTGIRQAYPEWWGAVGTGAVDDSAALIAQHACVQGSQSSDGGRPMLKFGNIQYGITQTITWKPTANINLGVEGGGVIFTGTRFKVMPGFNSVGPAIHVDGDTDGTQMISDWFIHGIGIVPTTVGSIGTCTGGLFIGSTDPAKRLIGLHRNSIDDLHISNIPNALQFCHTTLITVRRWSVWNDALTGANNCVKIFNAGGFTSDITFYDGQTVSKSGVAGANGVHIESNNAPWGGGGNTTAGIKFNNCDIYNGDRGAKLYCGSGSQLADIWFNPGCQFDGPNTRRLEIESNNTGSLLQDIHVLGVTMFGSAEPQINVTSTGTFGTVMGVYVNNCNLTGGSQMAVNVNANGGHKISGIEVNDNHIKDNASLGAVLQFDDVDAFNCRGNVATALAGQIFNYFVQIGATCNHFIVKDNNSGGLAATGAVNNAAGTGATKIVADNM